MSAVTTAPGTTSATASETHLLSWLADPPPARSLRFSDGHGGWQAYAYQDIAGGARRNAARLRRAGIAPGDVVLLLGQNTVGFVTSFYGVLHAGATPAIVAPVGLDELPQRLRQVIGCVHPAALLATRDHAAGLESVAGPLGCRVLAEAAEDDPMATAAPCPPDVALIQFSSGSTGAPRGVEIGWHALDTHVRALQRWLSVSGVSRTATWVPFYHDMGLVGCLLMPLAVGFEASYMPPQEFIGDPLRWLRELSASGTTVSAVPAFSLGHILRRVRPAQLEGLDFSRLENLIIGAERIDPDALRAFHRLLGPFGLSPDAFLPAYGLAEATLAVTGVRPDPHEVHTRWIDTGALEIGRRVAEPVAGSAAATCLVSCGSPLDGVGLDIVDGDGSPLPEGVFGEIAVSGGSLAAGYRQREFTAFGDRLRTGDMGFTAGGELYVVGRAGDGVKVNGRRLFAEDVQSCAAAASPRPQRTVALLGNHHGEDVAVVAVEDCTRDEASAVGRAVAAGYPGLRVIALLVPHGTLRRTTSGKPRRKAMWQDLVVSGRFAAHLVSDSRGGGKEQDTSTRGADH